MAAQEERGASGTLHIQFGVGLTTRRRFTWFHSFGLAGAHFEKTVRGNKMQICNYCTKADTRVPGGRSWIKGFTRMAEVDTISLDEMQTWQKSLVEYITTFKPDPRRTIWIWSERGGTGKSRLAKYLAVRCAALVLNGKSSDCAAAVVKHKEEKGDWPTLIVMDIPKSSHGHFSCATLEWLKNGVHFSGKYEGGQIIMNSPHVVVFSNFDVEIEHPNDFTENRFIKFEIGKDLIFEFTN